MDTHIATRAYTAAMTRPTPDQWSDGMSGHERAQFMHEVVPLGQVSLEMWMKVRRDGLVSAGTG